MITAFDSQFERVLPKFENNLITLHGTYIRENSILTADFDNDNRTATFAQHHLNTLRVNGVYHFGYRYIPSFGYFITTGTTGPLLYARSPLNGSRTGNPRSEGSLGNFTYWPIQNVRMAVRTRTTQNSTVGA